MNSIRQIQVLNKRELENAVPPEASWHADYRDTAYIYIGGLPYNLSEGDIITLFSQFGEPVHVNLVRDKETGKSRGFAFLKYEDQRSTDLAVDNLCGATVMGRVLRVDHVRYNRREDEGGVDNVVASTSAGVESRQRNGDNYSPDDGRKMRRATRESDDEVEQTRLVLKEERELEELIRDHDDEDPMKEYLIREKKEEVAQAKEKLKSSSKRTLRKREDDSERARQHRRHHRHPHRRRGCEEGSRSRERSHRDVCASPGSQFDRDRSSSQVYRGRKVYRDRSRSREAYHGDRALPRDRRSYRNQLRTKSSPNQRREQREQRRHQDR